MRLQSFLAKLIDRYFEFNNEEELKETTNIIVEGLKNLENSNVTFSNSIIIQQLNLVGKDRGIVFFDWDISTCLKLYYLITGKYPRIINISIKDDGIIVKVNSKTHRFLGKPTEKFKLDDVIVDRLEIDISDNYIKFILKEKES